MARDERPPNERRAPHWAKRTKADNKARGMARRRARCSHARPPLPRRPPLPAMQPLSPAGHPPGAVNERHPFSSAATTAGMGEQRERMADIARASAGGSRSRASGTPGKDETNQSQDRQARAAVQAGTPAAGMAGPAGLGCGWRQAGEMTRAVRRARSASEQHYNHGPFGVRMRLAAGERALREAGWDGMPLARALMGIAHHLLVRLPPAGSDMHQWLIQGCHSRMSHAVREY